MSNSPSPLGDLHQLGQYEILEKLGEGGMGAVYKARDTRLNRLVAIKVPPPARWTDESARKRFLREARAAAAIDHPNVCTVYEVGEAGDVLFIAMQLVEGQNLRQLLQNGPPPRAQFLDVALQAAEGLDAAHRQGLVHRDIKAANVMLTREGRVKILDFGIAKTVDASEDQTSTFTEAGQTTGTLAYMSPEQLRGLPLDTRSDLFSFGVLLYELIAGRLPFEHGTSAVTAAAILREEPMPLNRPVRDVPAELERIVGKALAKDREARYQTARDMLNDLAALRRSLERGVPAAATVAERLTNTRTGESPVAVGAAPQPGIPGAHRMWRPRGALAGAILFAALVVLGVWLVNPAGRQPTPASVQPTIEGGVVGAPGAELAKSPLSPTTVASGKPSIAALVFVNSTRDPQYEGFSTGLADSMAAQFLAGGQYRVVERAQIEQAIKELRLNQRDLVDPATAQRVGKIIGAQFLVLGSFQVWQGQIQIHARMLRTETAEVVAAERVTGDVKKALELPDELARKMGSGREKGQ